MKNLYFDLDISQVMVCHFEGCETVSPTYRYEAWDLTTLEIKSTNFDNIAEEAKDQLLKFGWRQMNGDWYCPHHAPVGDAEKEAS